MKGIISTLGMSCEGILAAGTFGRWVGLYDSGGRGGTVGVFSIKITSHSDSDSAEEDEGSGITQVTWSPCGRYLLIAERCSNGIGVWDIRGTGRRLAWLAGRKANTMQRLGIEVREGGEVWAGGTDGAVRVWEGLGRSEGRVERVWEFGAHDGMVFPRFYVEREDRADLRLQMRWVRRSCIRGEVCWRLVRGRDVLSTRLALDGERSPEATLLLLSGARRRGTGGRGRAITASRSGRCKSPMNLSHYKPSSETGPL